MSMINYASREINCKIVYYGPGLGGKTTNLEYVYGKVADFAHAFISTRFQGRYTTTRVVS